jgi:hypothetical protein
MLHIYHIQGAISNKITHNQFEGSSLLLARHFHIKRTVTGPQLHAAVAADMYSSCSKHGGIIENIHVPRELGKPNIPDLQLFQNNQTLAK